MAAVYFPADRVGGGRSRVAARVDAKDFRAHPSHVLDFCSLEPRA
jgi:hypothetical protein